MTNYDEFVRNNSADQQKDMSVSMGSGREKEANDATAKLWSISRLSLELNDSGHLSLNFPQSRDEIFGTGNMTLGKKTKPVGAFGKLFGDGLNLDIVPLSGKLYRFDVARKAAPSLEITKESVLMDTGSPEPPLLNVDLERFDATHIIVGRKQGCSHLHARAQFLHEPLHIHLSHPTPHAL
jgi:hypothetical protein